MEHTKEQRTIFWLIAIGILIILITSVIQLSSSNSGSGGKQDLQLQANENSKGPDDAKVNIVEYSDFQCPFCKASSAYLKQLAEEFPNDVQITYRYFPLRSIHSNAYSAALAAETASAQGKFWEMHDLLFERQNEWSNISDTTGKFVAYATELGLDTEKFKNDLLNNYGKDKVDNDLSSATNLKLKGTPSIFINGEQFLNLKNYESLKQEIEKYVQ